VQALLYANRTERKLSDSLGGPDFEWPELIEGDTVRIEPRFAQTLGDELEVDRSVRLVRASLGRPDTRPDDGHWRMCSVSRLYCMEVSSSENAIRTPEMPGS